MFSYPDNSERNIHIYKKKIQCSLKILYCIIIFMPALVLFTKYISDRFLCSSGWLHARGPRGASANSRWHCGDPGSTGPRPGRVHWNTRIHRSHWIRTQSPCQASWHHAPVRSSALVWTYRSDDFETLHLDQIRISYFLFKCRVTLMKSYLVYMQSGWGEDSTKG